jgi:dephospho-CoA kinase
MIWIGLTGGIASGKSTVSSILRSHGVPVVDADHLARQAVEPGSAGFRKVVEVFGTNVVGPDGSLDREALGRIVFADSGARSQLELIIHPRVRELAAQARQALVDAGAKLAFYDVPLLFEKNLAGNFDKVVVVACSYETQVKRLMSRNGFTRAEAVQRIASQMPLVLKTSMADRVVLNDGGLNELERGVLQLIEIYQAQT